MSRGATSIVHYRGKAHQNVCPFVDILNFNAGLFLLSSVDMPQIEENSSGQLDLPTIVNMVREVCSQFDTDVILVRH